MTAVNSPAAAATREPGRTVTSVVEWGAVIAGALFAAALSFVFIAFGSAIGLSMTSAWPDAGATARWTATLAAFWMLLQQIASFMAGGYLAGRLRKEPDSRTRETEFRDGMHGALVWALAIVIGAALAASAAMVVARVGAEAGRTAVSAASQNSDQLSYFADALLRPGQAQAQPGQPAAQPQQPVPQDVRDEITRIMARSALNREMSQQDRSYLATIVAQRTGMSPDEAQRRVSETFTQMEQSLRDAADKARKAGALGGFLTAASIVIAFAAAWWGAVRGGHHRDDNFTHSGFYLRSRRTQEFDQ
jgi:hypothetical protein